MEADVSYSICVSGSVDPTEVVGVVGLKHECRLNEIVPGSYFSSSRHLILVLF